MRNADAYRCRTLGQSYWPAVVDVPKRDLTLGDALREAALEAPDRPALIEGSREGGRLWTYSQLWELSGRVAQALLARFSPGERVAFWAPNVPEWIATLYGCALAGVTLVTVNPAYKRRELEYVLSKSRAAGVFLAASYRGFDMERTVREAIPLLPELREVLPLADYDAFVGGASGAQLPNVEPCDPAVIMFTSGTTGTQKGVIFNHVGVANMTNFTQRRGGLKEGGVFVNPMPMFHIGSLGHAGIGSVMMKATHVLMPEWDAENYMI